MLFVVLPVVAVLSIAAATLAVLVVRARAEVAALTRELDEAERARQLAESAIGSAEAEAATAVRERDDALVRAARARRDAAEVARRLRAEAEARLAAEAERESTVAERARLADELAAAEQAVAAGGEDEVAGLWSLALSGVQRTWEISVCPSPGMPSPLAGATDELRAAIEIEVDAAREEAGAAIDLEWTGDDRAPVPVAVRALPLVQELVGRLAKTADRASLVVDSTGGTVTISVEAVDVAGGDVVPVDVGPEYRDGPGRYVLPGSGARRSRPQV